MAHIVDRRTYTTGTFNENHVEVVTLADDTVYTIIRERDILTGTVSSTKVYRQADDVKRRSTLRAYRAEAGI